MTAQSSTPQGYSRDAGHLLRGVVMGAADVVPGVSGGTVALVTGIYERLVSAISRFDATLLGLLRRRQWSAAAAHVDLRFLAAVGCGILLGIVCLANLMKYLLDHHEVSTLSVFFGLIAASSLLVGRMVGSWMLLNVLLAAAAAGVGFWLTGFLEADREMDFAYLFLCGMVAICAMILPGISGAFILLILGMYHHVLEAVKGLTRGQWSGDNLATLAVFACGCAVGLLGFSKLLRWLLARFHAPTMAALCGFMIGSLRRIWPFKESQGDGAAKIARNVWPDGVEIVTPLLLAVVAAGLVIGFDFLARRRRQRRDGVGVDDAAIETA